MDHVASQYTRSAIASVGQKGSEVNIIILSYLVPILSQLPKALPKSRTKNLSIPLTSILRGLVPPFLTTPDESSSLVSRFLGLSTFLARFTRRGYSFSGPRRVSRHGFEKKRNSPARWPRFLGCRSRTHRE